MNNLILDEYGRKVTPIVFFSDRIEKLKNYSKTCNPAVVSLVNSSIIVNEIIRDSLKEIQTEQRQ
jgi:hypothetical protein